MATKPGRPSAIIADDHRVVHPLLRRILEPEFDVVEDVFDGLTLVNGRAAAPTRPDCRGYIDAGTQRHRSRSSAKGRAFHCGGRLHHHGWWPGNHAASSGYGCAWFCAESVRGGGSASRGAGSDERSTLCLRWPSSPGPSSVESRGKRRLIVKFSKEGFTIDNEKCSCKLLFVPDSP